MTRVFVVRHGQTDWNRERRIQGHTDIPLNSEGRDQALGAARRLEGAGIAALASSPLGRAVETATIIAGHVGVPLSERIPDVIEKHHGDGEGLTAEEIAARFPSFDEVPGMETREAVIARCVPAVVGFAERHRGRSVAIVSHGGVISALVRFATDYARPTTGDRIANGSVHEFAVLDGSLRLVEFDHSPADARLMA